MTPTGTEAKVCHDIAARQQLGIAKYSTTVEANPLTARQWNQHLYEELLDAVIYLRRLMDEMDAKSEASGPGGHVFRDGVCKCGQKTTDDPSQCTVH